MVKLNKLLTVSRKGDILYWIMSVSPSFNKLFSNNCIFGGLICRLLVDVSVIDFWNINFPCHLFFTAVVIYQLSWMNYYISAIIYQLTLCSRISPLTPVMKMEGSDPSRRQCPQLRRLIFLTARDIMLNAKFAAQSLLRRYEWILLLLISRSR